MTKATTYFTHTTPTGEILTFDEGDTVPDDVVALVGDHVIDSRPGVAPEGPSVEELTAAGADEALLAQLAEKDELLETALAENDQLAARVEELVAEVEKLSAVRDAIASGDLSGVNLDDLGAGPSGDDDAKPYDPSEHAPKEVLAYLEQADEAEDKRVRDLERAGKNRKTILGED